jgi:biopolymer transport protein ExbB
MHFVELGGAVMFPLMALGVAMWSSLLLRWFNLLLGWRGSVESLVEEVPEGADGLLPRAAARASELVRASEPVWRLHLHFDEARHALQRGRVSTDMMIAAAPLLGLLGTITGMIDTFDVLGFGERVGYSEAMARGISKALITTEFGLFLAIPGILMSRALRRREVRIERSLHELESRFAARVAEAKG